jgi:hypothetical protein
LIDTHTGSTGLEQNASCSAIRPNESRLQVRRKYLAKYRTSEALDVRI